MSLKIYKSLNIFKRLLCLGARLKVCLKSETVYFFKRMVFLFIFIKDGGTPPMVSEIFFPASSEASCYFLKNREINFYCKSGSRFRASLV